MPEKQLEQIFTVKRKEQLTPLAAFLRALFSLEGDDSEKKRKRVRQLWSWILTQFSNYSYAADLVGEDICSFSLRTFHGQFKQFIMGTLRE